MNCELFNLYRRDGAVCVCVCVLCVYELLCVFGSFDRGELVSSKVCFSVVLLLRRERIVFIFLTNHKQHATCYM